MTRLLCDVDMAELAACFRLEAGVDGAKVLRSIVMAAMKRRLPQAIERVLRQKTPTGERRAGSGRGSEGMGGKQEGKRLAMRAGSPVREHV